MKTRIIVAVIFVPVIFVILFFLPPIVISLGIVGISAIASFELLRATGSAALKRLCIYTALTAAIIPITVLLGLGDLVFRAVLFLFIAILFADAVLSSQKAHTIKLSQLTAAVLGGVIIPYFLSAIISLKLLGNGHFYVLIPFIIAFTTDGGAYFTGVFFGKHKAFPLVSPKKTVEGFVGGITTCVASMVLYGVILHLSTGFSVDFWALVTYGLVGGIVTELGDLAFSLIKREFDIKDYSHLLPGHGGMLDRFDSMIFAAPVIFLLVSYLPAF